MMSSVSDLKMAPAARGAPPSAVSTPGKEGNCNLGLIGKASVTCPTLN